ncbi:cytochrome P450 [Actinomadura fulvescens]|uniref:Cytochrome P450 n=1 Tax=Actinomadura fulvescens TaxID=46160 RepID=A0ABN3PT88_9ACTN
MSQNTTRSADRTAQPGAAAAEPPEFPMQRTCPFDPPAEYAALRAEQPAVRVRVPTGQIAWLVTRYEDVRRLLVDPRVSADRFHAAMPMTEEVTAETRRRIAASGRSLIGLDQPEHGPRRRMLIPEFTLRRAQELRPHIQHTVDDCVDEILAGPKPVDLVTALAEPVPARTLTQLLGMPYEDRELIERTATAMLRRNVTPEERQRTGGEMRAYVDRLVSAKEADPTDDLLGRLVLRNRETRIYDHDLMVGVTMLLLIAGFETTVNMIALGAAALLQEPDRLPEITADPAAAGRAVEELLRYFSVVDALPRVTTADIEVGGVTIPADSGLLLSFASANWDDTVFPDAATMDSRRGARHHLAFGYGIHQCIGQNLARAELEIVFRTLFTRIPGLRLATELDRLPFKRDSNIYGVDALPVTW